MFKLISRHLVAKSTEMRSLNRSSSSNRRMLTTSTCMRQQRPRRAVMYVPGHDEKKLKKISSLSADCVLLDCEDGVGFDK